MSWFSLVIGQNASRQLATSSKNLVASAQFLVTLATSESQFRALVWHAHWHAQVAKPHSMLNIAIFDPLQRPLFSCQRTTRKEPLLAGNIAALAFRENFNCLYAPEKNLIFLKL